MYSDAYIALIKRGAFPGRVDPFAETGRYFQQIHGMMIRLILEEIQEPLLRMGYVAASETSLQILERREPDIMIRTTAPIREKRGYAAALAELDIEPGLVVDDTYFDLDAIFIYAREGETKRLVTVLEVISPRNKHSPTEMLAYQARRQTIIDQHRANFVEIDATRSINRLYEHFAVAHGAYATVVYPPDEPPYLFGSGFDQPLRVFGLPLDNTALRIETQRIYEHAYQSAGIASQIIFEGGYTEAALPFPSLLTEDQRADVMAKVRAWKTELDQLRPPKPTSP